MNFEDEDINPGLKSESELGIEFMVRLSFQILKNANLNIEGSYLRIFTNIKIDLLFVSAGIDYSFNSPDWLRDFLNLRYEKTFTDQIISIIRLVYLSTER